MRRSLTAMLIFACAFSVSIAFAGMPNDDENEYEGRIENTSGTYFGFDLNASKTKVKGITARVGHACENDDLVIVLAEADGDLSLNGARRFSGNVSNSDPDYKVKYHVEGKLRNHGRARGILRGSYKDDSYETPCRTGKVHWRAKRGADIDAR